MGPKYVSLGPCAMGFFTMLGSISNVSFNDIQEIAGASAGALLSFFICLGMTYDQIVDVSLRIDVPSFVKPNLITIFTKYGMTSVELVKKKLIEIANGDPTFHELQQSSNKKLFITAFCISTGETVYFSVDTHPTMKVIDALSMSIAVPLLFEAISFENNLYIDGGLIENTPMKYFIDKEPKEVLSLSLSSTLDDDKITSFRQFVIKLILVCKKSIEYSSTHMHTKYNIFQFSLSHADKMKMLQEGVKYCKSDG